MKVIKSTIYMPKLGNNDMYVTIVQWYKKDGEFCEKGQPICMLETTKHAQELFAECCGYIKLYYDKDEDVRIGERIADIFSEPIEKEVFTENNFADERNESDYKITNKAKQLIEKYGIDISVFDADVLIKEKDVLRLVREGIVENRMNTAHELLILGSGGFCKSVIDILKSQGKVIKGIIDYNYPDVHDVMGVPVIGGFDSLKKWYELGYTQIINTVSLNRKQRDRRYHMLKDIGFELPNVIHSRATVEPSAVLGEGNIVMAGAYVGSQTVVGNNCIFNVNAVVSHDCKIGNSVNVASGAVVAGIVTIGDRTIIGQCSSVYWGLRIGSDVLIENGCHIFEDLVDNMEIRQEKR